MQSHPTQLAELTDGLQTTAAKRGTFTLHAVDHSEAEISALLLPSTWTTRACEVLCEGLVSSGFNIAENSLELKTLETTTWTAEQATELLGVRVTRVDVKGYPKVGPG
ncbi:hypothetical protein ACPCG0_05800 [Propionibacteriaceae bacterium Y1923]|uniref:hypothetical protein n=1 Tax=Aestuariimicrobium sp. Y1814 TaxID=3418742 RepID=UPI003C2926C9